MRYSFGDHTLDAQVFQLRRSGELVEISRQAFDLLIYLIEHRDRVVSRQELLEELWSDRTVTDNAVSQAVTAARRAIGDVGSEAHLIETVRGRGFRFVAALEGGSAADASLPAADASIPAAAADPSELERRDLVRAFGAMLSDLYGDLRPVRLFAATRQSSEAQEVSVASVYTALDITLEAGGAPSGSDAAAAPRLEAAERSLAERIGRALQGDLERESEAQRSRGRRRARRRIRAVEAAAVLPRLVVVGPPGSGKSTFVQHLALCLAGSLLGYEEANVGRLRERSGSAPAWMPWEQCRVLPLFVELAQFAVSESFPAPGTEGTSSHLFAYLAQRAAGRAPQGGALEAHVQERDGDGVLLILDGLDETPVQHTESGERDPDGTRDRLKQVIRSFVHRFAKGRVIVTSRPYAYEPGSPWRLDAQGFEVVQLADLSAVQVRTFCKHWYVGMAERRVIPEEEVEPRAAALVAEFEKQAYLAPLVERPLTLTMIADLHTQEGVLPSSRAALYEESAILFLNRWNAARSSQRPGENRLTVELRISLEELRRSIDHLAYQAQCVAEGKSTAALSAGDIIDLLFRHGAKGESERILDFLSERSGILVADSRHLYRFPHRSYQEYLAACYLTYREFPDRLIEAARSDPERWREVVQLALGRMRSMPYMAVGLIDQLLDEGRGDSAAEREFLAYLCAAGVEEAGLREAVQAQSPRVFARLRQLLIDGIQRGAAAESDRVRAGDVLGQFGDPRVAELDRVRIPAGSFWMGAQREDPAQRGYDPDAWPREGPVSLVEISAFELARYPVTVSQFERFIAGGGYKDPQLWDADGWAWRESRSIEAPTRWPEQLGYPSRPVVGMSFHEASAFARWAGGRLPTEAEWEYAARGGSDRRYAWGNDEPSEDHAAYGGRFQHPVPVGLYPRAAQLHPWKLCDVAGNVGEWCGDSATTAYPRGPRKDPADRLAGLPVAVRGGWFAGPTRWMRAANREAAQQELRDNNALGFRVAWSIAPAAQESAKDEE